MRWVEGKCWENVLCFNDLSEFREKKMLVTVKKVTGRDVTTPNILCRLIAKYCSSRYQIAITIKLRKVPEI